MREEGTDEIELDSAPTEGVVNNRRWGYKHDVASRFRFPFNISESGCQNGLGAAFQVDQTDVVATRIVCREFAVQSQ